MGLAVEPEGPVGNCLLKDDLDFFALAVIATRLSFKNPLGLLEKPLKLVEELFFGGLAELIFFDNIKDSVVFKSITDAERVDQT